MFFYNIIQIESPSEIKLRNSRKLNRGDARLYKYNLLQYYIEFKLS